MARAVERLKAEVRIMSYEIDKKLAAKERKERKARSFFPCDLCVLLRLFPLIPGYSRLFRKSRSLKECGLAAPTCPQQEG